MYKSYLVYFLLITFPLVSVAENCDVMNGQWEVTESASDNCGLTYEIVYINNVENGREFRQSTSLIKSNNPKVTYTGDPTGGTCTMSDNDVSINSTYKLLFFDLAPTHYDLRLTPDKMSYKGTFTNPENCAQSGTVSGRRLSPYTAKQKPITGGGGEAKLCIDKDYSGNSKGFKLYNKCSESVNLKFTFNESKPFSETYITLRPNEKTFDAASETEKYEFYACYFPNIPQTLTGECTRQTKQKNYTKNASGSGEAKDCVARAYTDGDDTFQFINTCSDQIVIKYMLSVSKPKSDGVLILQSGATTPEKALEKEKYTYSACYPPNIPKTISGKCTP